MSSNNTMVNNFTAFQTIVKKEVNRFMRIWTQTLLPPIITQSLYFVIFGGVIGSRLQDIPIGNGQSVPYMQFIVPGLVMMGVLTSAFSNTVSSFFGSKFQKNIEEMLVAPVPNWIIIWGYVVGGALRGILVGAIIFAVAFAFNAVPHVDNYFIIAIFTLLTAIVFSMAGLTNGIFATKFDDVSIFPTFVLTPLSYLGGVFYSINALPPLSIPFLNYSNPQFWQTISKANPIVYMIDGFRFGFFGVSDFNPLVSFGILITMAVILGVVNNHLLNKGTGMRS
jgi:ABC-2 type transport system permease protein